MATATGSPVFVDTNILVYARLAAALEHSIAVETLDRLTTLGVELWTSRQVFREYLASITRPSTVTPPLATTALIADVRGFEARFRIAEDGPAVTAELLRLLATVTSQGKQIHDANIVATMLVHGIPNLLTHNVADFIRFAGVINVVPLVPPATAALPISSAPPPPPPGAP
jgi:predicted nucleic acid-binding protein